MIFHTKLRMTERTFTSKVSLQQFSLVVLLSFQGSDCSKRRPFQLMNFSNQSCLKSNRLILTLVMAVLDFRTNCPRYQIKLQLNQ
jgi:hypothetical protein